MSSADQNQIPQPNVGDFKKYRKMLWLYNPFYRNFFKNWWDCFLRNIERESKNFSTKFIKGDSLKNNEAQSEENSYIYMDDMSEMSQDEEPFETQEAAKLQKSAENSEAEPVEPSMEDSTQYLCGCDSENSDSERVLIPKRTPEKMSAEELELKIQSMMESFRFLEQLSIDFKENYCNYSSEPLFCIFSLHCPQREKSLMHLYEKIVKVRNKLRKVVQKSEKPDINI